MRIIDADALQIDGVDLEKETPVVDFALAVIKAVQNAPTIDPEELRPKGRWKRVQDSECYWYECSVCGEKPLRRYNHDCFTLYCPFCGARMEDDDD